MHLGGRLLMLLPPGA